MMNIAKKMPRYMRSGGFDGGFVQIYCTDLNVAVPSVVVTS